MASPKIPSCSFDDKDLDDAALLALDSAAASISGSGESPQIKRPDTQAPASDSHRSPQLPGSAEARSTVPVQPSQPEMYQSPDSGRSGSNLMRATVTHGQSKENEVMRNRSSGKFRSVSLFKEYQKEAMAVNIDFLHINYNIFIFCKI